MSVDLLAEFITIRKSNIHDNSFPSIYENLVHCTHKNVLNPQ